MKRQKYNFPRRQVSRHHIVPQSRGGSNRLENIAKVKGEDHPIYKRLVREVLTNYEPATNNDLILYLEVLRVLKKIFVEDRGDYIKIVIRKSDIAYIPQSESITRARRSLNQRGICLPTDEEVLHNRAMRCKSMQKYMRENSSLNN